MTGVVMNGRKLAGEQIITGIPRYMKEILMRAGSEVEVVGPPPQYVSNMPGNLWDQLALPFLLKGRLLWSPNNTGPLWVRNQVVTVHDVMPLERPDWFQPGFVQLFRAVVPRLVNRVKRVITVSEYSKRRMMDLTGVAEERVVVIPNGVDHTHFYPRTEAEISNANVGLKIPSPRYILSLGAADPRKNLKCLIEAWSRVLPRLPDDVWLVVTGGRPKLARAIGIEEWSLPPHIHFTGFVDDELLPALISGAQALVFPSFYEGFGLPPLEAMACGVPAIVSECTSLPEVVGDAGLFVDPQQPDTIAEAIERIWGEPGLRPRLSELSLRQARRFDWEHTAEQTMTVLLREARSV